MANNLLRQKNKIKKGLNFLVPKQWWQIFSTLNKDITSASQILFPQVDPLQSLLESQIISTNNELFKQQIQQVEQFYIQWLKNTKQDIKKGFHNKKIQKQKQVYLKSIQILHDIQQNYEKGWQVIFQTPLISFYNLKQFGLEESLWQVISPQVYQYIICRQRVKNNHQNIISFPVIINDFNSFGQPQFMFQRMTKISVCQRSIEGVRYYFQGFVYDYLSIEKTLFYIHNAINSIFGHTSTEDQNNYNLQLITQIQINHKARKYYKTKGDDQLIYNQQIKDFGVLDEISVLDISYDLIKIASKKHNLKRPPPFQLQKIKQQKRKIFKSNTAGYINSKKGFQRVSIHHERIQQQNNHITDVETASNIPQNQIKLIKHHEFSRLEKPLWNQISNIQALRNLAKINTSLSNTLLPNFTYKNIICRDTKNKKISILNKTNDLVLNKDLYEQVESKNNQIEQQPSQAVLETLQNLAREMQFFRFNQEQQFLNENKTQILKEKQQIESKVQSKTCKNEDIEYIEIQDQQIQ